MKPIKLDILPPPKHLENYVECFRVVECSGGKPLSINVAPNAAPGVVFQNNNGRSTIESIVTRSAIRQTIPTLFLYGAGTAPSIMNFAKGSYTNIQVVLKPQALSTLFGLNAAALTDGFAELSDFSAENLNDQLFYADAGQERISLLTDFLTAQLETKRPKDELIEASLDLIQQNIVGINVKSLLERLNISERQFERRFNQAVGISPQSYIRVKRFNEAVRLIKNGRYEKLTDIAYALNFYDQSHLIRDINTFSGGTPKNISRRADDFYDAQNGYSFI
jgi:AraC-like DNA-binding protein